MPSITQLQHQCYSQGVEIPKGHSPIPGSN